MLTLLMLVGVEDVNQVTDLEHALIRQQGAINPIPIQSVRDFVSPVIVIAFDSLKNFL